MSQSFHYDALILGSSLSGLISASLLAQRGKRVFVVDGGEFPRAAGEGVEGFVSPAPLYLSSLLLRRFLRELNFHPAEVAQFDAADPLLQVVLPRRRLAFYRDQRRLGREIEREFPAIGALAKDYFEKSSQRVERLQSYFKGIDHFPPSGFRQRREYQRYLKEGNFAELLREPALKVTPNGGEEGFEFRRIREALFMTDAHSTLGSAATEVLLARPFYLARQGGCRFSGKWQELCDSFFKKIVQRGGTIANGCRIEQFLLDKKRVVGVRLSGYQKSQLQAPAVVINGNVHSAVDLFREIKHQENFKKFSKRFKPAFVRRTLQLLVFHGGLPAGLEGDLLLIGDPLQELEEENCILVSRSPFRQRRDHVKGDKILLSCTYLVRSEKAEQPEIAEQVKQRVFAMMPFLQETLADKRSFLDGLELSAGQATPKSPPFQEDFIYQPGQLKNASQANHDFSTPYAGLYLTGRSVFPALGLDGEILAGRGLVERIVRGG